MKLTVIFSIFFILLFSLFYDNRAASINSKLRGRCLACDLPCQNGYVKDRNGRCRPILEDR